MTNHIYYLAKIKYSDDYKKLKEKTKAVGIDKPYHGLLSNLEAEIKSQYPSCPYTIEEIDSERFDSFFGD